VGGNVSFYNETRGPATSGRSETSSDRSDARAILPTPIIGVVGLLEDAGRLATQWFKGGGQRIALLGGDAVSFGASEYLWALHRRLAGTLAPLDLELERRVQSAVQASVEAGLATAAHDCSEGGLAVALGECCVTGPEPVGCAVTLPETARRADLTLFGEGPSRVIVTVDESRVTGFEALMAESAIPWRWIGTTGGERLQIAVGAETLIDAALGTLGHAWRTGFERHLT
jgi:phosphoribosylformylglycinamidine synthase